MSATPYVSQRANGESLTYKYGEFFPFEASPFAYNETLAQDYFPLTAEIANFRKMPWMDLENKDKQITLLANDVPDNVSDADEKFILNQTIECRHQGKCGDPCAKAFRIAPWEIQFYKKTNLPFPQLCPNCRHFERLRKTNPLKLWHRSCQCNQANSKSPTHSTSSGQVAYRNIAEHFHGSNPCPNEFETSYATDRPEIVYCEACYNAEIL